MTDEQLEIARALVTHPRWRWEDGIAWQAPLDSIAGRMTSRLRAEQYQR